MLSLTYITVLAYSISVHCQMRIAHKSTVCPLVCHQKGPIKLDKSLLLYFNQFICSIPGEKITQAMPGKLRYRSHLDRISRSKLG